MNPARGKVVRGKVARGIILTTKILLTDTLAHCFAVSTPAYIVNEMARLGLLMETALRNSGADDWFTSNFDLEERRRGLEF